MFKSPLCSYSPIQVGTLFFLQYACNDLSTYCAGACAKPDQALFQFPVIEIRRGNERRPDAAAHVMQGPIDPPTELTRLWLASGDR